MQIDVSYDSSVSNAPAGFVAAVNYVVNTFDGLFTNNVTINIDVGYGEINGQALAAGALGESYAPQYLTESYLSVKNALQALGAPGASALPSTSPLSGSVSLSQAEAQALKLTAAISTSYVGFSNSLPFSYTANATPASNQYYFIGVVEHEITEDMGRVSLLDQQPSQYSPIDLFRFTSPGVHDLSTGGAGSTAYFSIDNGATNLGSWNNNPGNGDLADWYPSGPAAGGHDAFNDFSSPGVIDTLSSSDITLMQALGWTIQAAPTSTLIQTDGATSLIQQAGVYYMAVAGSGVELKYGGAPVTVGEFGNIAPIGAIQTATGYDIAWKIPGTNQLTFWAIDSNGNYTSNITGLVSGNSLASESLETTFGQDLNGDGTIGVTASLIQQVGSTSLLQIANSYFMYVGGNGPELMYGGAPVTVGEFGNIAPIGALQTATGYEVVWQIPGTNEFTLWSTDSNGNYTSNLTGLVTGNDFAIESLETAFGKDLNGDGTIGVTSSLIQQDISTDLLKIANVYYMYVAGSGPELKYGGAPVTVGEFGSIVPIGAVQTATGYDIAWKIPGTNEFTFWTTDSNGNYTSNITGLVTGSDATLISLETVFQQNFNVNGAIGSASSEDTAANAFQASAHPAATSSARQLPGVTSESVDTSGDSATTGSGPRTVGWHFRTDDHSVAHETITADNQNVAGHTETQTLSSTIGVRGSDSFAFHPVSANAKGAATIDPNGSPSLAGISHWATFPNETPVGQSEYLSHLATDGHDGAYDSTSMANIHLNHLHAGNFFA